MTVSDTAAKTLLDQRVATLATALQDKRNAVEDFKSANAVLRELPLVPHAHSGTPVWARGSGSGASVESPGTHVTALSSVV